MDWDEKKGPSNEENPGNQTHMKSNSILQELSSYKKHSEKTFLSYLEEKESEKTVPRRFDPIENLHGSSLQAVYEVASVVKKFEKFPEEFEKINATQNKLYFNPELGSPKNHHLEYKRENPQNQEKSKKGLTAPLQMQDNLSGFWIGYLNESTSNTFKKLLKQKIFSEQTEKAIVRMIDNCDLESPKIPRFRIQLTDLVDALRDALDNENGTVIWGYIVRKFSHRSLELIVLILIYQKSPWAKKFTNALASLPKGVKYGTI